MAVEWNPIDGTTGWDRTNDAHWCPLCQWWTRLYDTGHNVWLGCTRPGCEWSVPFNLAPSKELRRWQQEAR